MNQRTIDILLEERRTYIEALVCLASFSDTIAQKYLYETGSYSAFDNPGTVRLAREALEKGADLVKDKNIDRSSGAGGDAGAEAGKP